MPGVQEATDALRAALHKRGVESHAQEAFDNLAPCLVLLNSSSPSVQMIQKLCTVLRQPFLPLYKACLQPALQLSSSVLSTVLGKLCDAQNAEDESLRAAWDGTAKVILSGILDFLDQKDGANAESDGAVWEVLYRIICEFFFLDSGRGLPTFSIPLCLSAYNTLTETAARQITIRNALRQRAVLGGERLGAAISGTKDYLLLEALLMLFARLLPPIHNTSQGKFRRIKFVKEVLGSPKLFKCSAELLDVMQKTSDIHWDNVSAQIIDVLARSDITYPQPFAIDEIHVCGRIFPQPLATDRLIMDRQAFLANIVVENDDICESLQVPYSHIRAITLDNSEENVPKGKVLIMVYLTSPPSVANVEMKSLDESHLHAKFLLQNDVIGRFMEGLRRRGVGKLSFLNPLTRVERKRKSISIGSGFKFTNDSSPIPPTASFEGKVQHVNQVYKTDIEDTTTFQAIPVSHVGDAGSVPPLDPKPPSKNENLVPEGPESAVAGDVPATRKSSGSVPPINEASKPIQEFTFPCFSGNSTGATHLFGDSDELSEISEFEADNNTAFERAATRVSVSCNREPKPPRHRIDRVRMNEISISTSKRIKKSSESTSKLAGCTEEVAQRSPGTRRPLLTSDSPKLLSNTDTPLTMVGTEVVDCLSVASQDFVGADMLEKTCVNEFGPSDTEPIVAWAWKPHVESSSAKDELGQHARRVTSSSGVDQEVHPRIEITKDTSVPLKIAGSRRKRESVKFPSKPITDADDEHPPPRKKSRRDRPGTEEDKVKPNETSLGVIPISKAKRYPKAVKRSSPCIDLTAVDFGELPERKPKCQGTRRSSRIKKKQTTATGGVRPNATRAKIQKVEQAVSQSVSSAKHKKSATASLQDAGAEIGHRTQSILNSRPIPPVIKESPFPKINQAPLVELSDAENITPEANLPREMLQDKNIIACAPSEPSVAPGKEPRRNPSFIQEAASDAMQFNQEQFHIKDEEVIDDRHLVSDVRTVDNNEVSWVREVVEYSVSLKGSEDPVELSRPIMESTPRTETVTIDLTSDDSPIRENSELYEASIDPVRSETVTQTKFRTPDLSDGIAIEELALIPSPRHKRRSVTFASPIEYVLDKKIKSKTQVSSSSRQSPSPSESSTLSPLRIPTGTANVRHESSGRITPRVTLQNSTLLHASVHDEIVDEVGIQDIVEVLDEIQAVIIKGISDKFRNVKKGVQRSRDELVQQVLDELRGMVVENARYFNGLLRLEEDYYKNRNAIIRCWEELIDCNDSIAVQFRNALKEHDQNISARTFPKSLLPMQPVFPRRRANV